ncbi:hypothetical protein TrST_g1371 [Triparma strigata]|uniref:Uncharacterized protein n=1 Tax=Triparma strigata TaxID=1606541 RepID=A0A9W7AGP8_9STRA|nr:hypothetical protein TrST_g1371 [Triparma strigata]
MSDKVFHPSRAHSESLGWQCANLEDYQNPCPLMMDCWANETGTPTCQCATIALLSQDNWPECGGKTSLSALPIGIGIINVIFFAANIGWACWMVMTLRQLKMFQMNPVTKALIFTALASFFGVVHQGVETVQMLISDEGLHAAFYGGEGVPTSIGSLCLAGIGAFLVLADFSIPLLWIQIASAGMNKAEAAARAQKANKVTRISSGFFVVSFLGIWFTGGATAGGSYSILWMLIICGLFNFGARKLRAQLAKPGEEPTKTIVDIMNFVRAMTVCMLLYIVVVAMFIIRSSDKLDNDSHKWFLWAGLLYHCLCHLIFRTMLYIRRSLDKKLSKFKANGNKVTPTTMVSSTAD